MFQIICRLGSEYIGWHVWFICVYRFMIYKNPTLYGLSVILPVLLGVDQLLNNGEWKQVFIIRSS